MRWGNTGTMIDFRMLICDTRSNLVQFNVINLSIANNVLLVQGSMRNLYIEFWISPLLSLT